jgi:hypothetical protein
VGLEGHGGGQASVGKAGGGRGEDEVTKEVA